MTVDIEKFLTILAEEVRGYQVPVVDLIAVQTNDPYRILAATILSARTRDEVTAKAAAKLFQKAPDLQSLARLNEKEIEKLIAPVGFFRNKAGYLAKLPEALASQFHGVIPDTVEALCTLPGVGRKTANLVVAVAFKKPAICVDTHVHRIMNIWGYVETKTPLESEMALRRKLPEKHWLTVNSILVAFGQGTCKSVRPHCDRCVLTGDCPKIGVTPRKIQGGIISMNNSLKMVSWNVNGIRAIEKKGFVDLVNEFACDILALQEIKAQPEQLSEDLLKLDGYRAYWHPAEKKGYAGVCTYSRLEPMKVLYGIGVDEFDREGRVLTLEFPDFFFVNGYFPNAQHGLARLDFKLAFNRELGNFCRKLAARKGVVLTGDYNVAHKPIDLANPEANEKNPGFTPEERASMDAFLDSGFVDTFRMFNE
ncbi:MAG: exodeoxyribonuclease III, partial [Proteobacteria bacterium]|nr:exodeoxyribonuclease III [Pseudomonadota bacterium]MBU1737857.1 exodeoxyribonuclease III [Pseudomonadota bacterium]